MSHTRVWSVLVLTGMATVSGCASNQTQSLYRWGTYEKQLYLHMVKADTTSPAQEIAQLETDRRSAEAHHNRLPPGWHAHLATLYAKLGQVELATAELRLEKSNFPESTVLMERLEKNLTHAEPVSP